MYRSSSSPAPSPARPGGQAAAKAGHPADNGVRTPSSRLRARKAIAA